MSRITTLVCTLLLTTLSAIAQPLNYEGAWSAKSEESDWVGA